MKAPILCQPVKGKSLFGHGHVVMDIDASSIALAGDAWDAVTKMSGARGSTANRKQVFEVLS